MHQELLFEIGTEEIPAGYISPVLEKMKELLAARLNERALSFDTIRTVATPRRLTVCVSGLVDCQQDRKEEFLGPPKKAAFTGERTPTKAAIGFAASKGVAVEDLQVVSTPKGEYVSITLEIKGETTPRLLAELLPQLVHDLPFPKSMRWGHHRFSFARPIQWLLALYGGQVIPFAIGGIESGNTTRGHRFMAPDPLVVTDFAQYRDSLRAGFVLVDSEERRSAVIREIVRAAAIVGGEVRPDDELVDTVTNLVEYPHAICGEFEHRFLDLPDSVLVTAMREHQKYFCVQGSNGKLQPNFVAVNNTGIKDLRMAASGHQRVLRARLEDALFFFRDDQTRKLGERVADLVGITFQAGLGTMREKTARVERLAAVFAGTFAPGDVATVERAAHLCKADLLTALVNEFPSLQGVMGRDYALLDGEDERVSEAILDHYRPVRSGGELPRGIVGALVSMADRLDSIVGCFGIGQVPSGTADPFGLRRLALGFIHIIEARGFTLDLDEAIRTAIGLYGGQLTQDHDLIVSGVSEFIKGRFVHNLISVGVPGSAVEAVVSVSCNELVDCRARIDALAAIRQEPTFTTLAAAFKRVMNIVKDNKETAVVEELLQSEAERDLYRVFRKVEGAIAPLLDKKEYGLALEHILQMKEPVDTFFDEVMVMVDDAALKDNRLNLLTAIAGMFLRIGDFSKMQISLPG